MLVIKNQIQLTVKKKRKKTTCFNPYQYDPSSKQSSFCNPKSNHKHNNFQR